MGGKKTNASVRALRGQTVLQLSVAGYSGREIAAKMQADGWSISPTTVHRDLHRELAMIRERNNEQYDVQRAIMSMRLNKLLSSCWDVATGSPPNYEAMNMVLNIIKQQSRLYGLDIKPVQPIEHSGSVDVQAEVKLDALTNDDIRRLLAMLDDTD